MQKRTKVAVTSAALATIIVIPTAVFAYGKDELYDLLDSGDYSESRNSTLRIADEGMSLRIEPAWDNEYKKQIVVDGSFKIKNTSKAYSQRVYASKAKFYAYRDGAVYYTLAEANTKYKLEDFTLKPGATSKQQYAEFVRSSKGFSKTKAEYYCLHVPVKEGKGKEHSVGMCVDNVWFKK